MKASINSTEIIIDLIGKKITLVLDKPFGNGWCLFDKETGALYMEGVYKQKMAYVLFKDEKILLFYAELYKLVRENIVKLN